MRIRFILFINFMLILLAIPNRNYTAYSGEKDHIVYLKQLRNCQVNIIMDDEGNEISNIENNYRQILDKEKDGLVFQQENFALFEPYVAYPVGLWTEAVSIGDINGDGRNDVVLTTEYEYYPLNESRLFVFLQTSSGTLDVSAEYVVGDGDSVDIGDLNNDGKNDVVVTSFDGIGLLLQNDKGSLDPMILYNTTNDPYKVRIGDFNNDGLLDVASIAWGIQENGYDVNVFLQNLQGTLNAPDIYTVLHGGYDDLDVGDINGDGLSDIVVMSGQYLTYENLGVLYQNNSGGFNPPVYYDLGGESELAHGVAIGDVNGDSLKDVVVTYWDLDADWPYHFIDVFLQNSTGALDSPISYESPERAEPVVIGRVNNDCRQDVVVVDTGIDAVGIFIQNYDGYLRKEELYDIPQPQHPNPHGLAIGDINSDWKNDVVIADYNHGLVILYGICKLKYILSINAGDGGTTTPSPSTNCYDGGQEISLKAIPESGYRFSGWSGDASGADNPITLTMDSDKSIKANFEREIISYTLSIKSGTGGTTSPASGIYSYDEGTEATITAIPNAHFRFSHWSGDTSSSDNPITITMDSNKSIKANFIRQYTLTTESGSGGTTNPSPGSYIYDKGTKITITAIPDAHYQFSGWSGDRSGLANPITIRMNSDKSIIANFIRIIYSPLNFTGQKVLNRSLSQAEYINVFSWQSNPNNTSIMKYRIYQIEGASQSLLIELNANTFEYWHRKVEKDKLYIYAICAVNDENREGDPTHITIK